MWGLSGPVEVVALGVGSLRPSGGGSPWRAPGFPGPGLQLALSDAVPPGDSPRRPSFPPPSSSR